MQKAKVRPFLGSMEEAKDHPFLASVQEARMRPFLESVPEARERPFRESTKAAKVYFWTRKRNESPFPSWYQYKKQNYILFSDQ